MRIPAEVIFSNIKGGVLIETGPYSGQWRRAGRLVAEWRRDENKRPVVTWHQSR